MALSTCGKNHPEKIASIVAGVAEGCVQSGAALVGGETAEHPGMMALGNAAGVGDQIENQGDFQRGFLNFRPQAIGDGAGDVFVEEALAVLRENGEEAYIMGEIVSGGEKVVLC